jgi:hypothetical protein
MIGIPILGASIIFNEDLIILFDGALVIPLSFLKLIGIILIIIGTLTIYPRFEKLKMDDIEIPKKESL